MGSQLGLATVPKNALEHYLGAPYNRLKLSVFSIYLHYLKMAGADAIYCDYAAGTISYYLESKVTISEIIPKELKTVKFITDLGTQQGKNLISAPCKLPDCSISDVQNFNIKERREGPRKYIIFKLKT